MQVEFFFSIKRSKGGTKREIPDMMVFWDVKKLKDMSCGLIKDSGGVPQVQLILNSHSCFPYVSYRIGFEIPIYCDGILPIHWMDGFNGFVDMTGKCIGVGLSLDF